MICGVILPTLAIGAELVLRMCQFILDPMPTYWHLAALALVPVANLFAYFVLKRESYRHVPAATIAVGAAIGVSAVYCLQFILLVPFFVIAIIAAGLGLLGLSPYGALAASIIAARRLALMECSRRLLWLGVAAAVLPFAVYVVTNEVTIEGLKMASSDNEATSTRGVRLIRKFGSDSALLRLCYGQSVSFWPTETGFFGRIESSDQDAARVVYYRVTGRPFTSAPQPSGMVGARTGMDGAWDFDTDIGGTAVNGQVRKLGLTSSNMDTVVQPESLTSYNEWTLLFKNDAELQREARAEIALPHDAVVSRLTLWVNGEPREAAFSTRGNVRAAYQDVAVAQRRDPALVTTKGPDRVLMQCFPVPPRGGTMKVRLGITAPLRIGDNGKASYTLPRFVERNFGVTDDLKHTIMTGSRRMELTDADLAGSKSNITAQIDQTARTVWTPDTVEPDKYAVVQTIHETQADPPDDLVIVIDGSVRMRDAQDQIASALHALPSGGRFAVILAGDETQHLTRMIPSSPDAIRRAQEAIRDARFVGGIDNRSALIDASDALVKSRDGLILWIHGPQSFETDSKLEKFLQVTRNRRSVGMLAVEAVPGTNGVLAALEESGAASVLARNQDLRTDLVRLFETWSGKRPLTTIERMRVLRREAHGTRGSSHIARLWARDEAARMCARDSRLAQDASKLAAEHQVVTPVSGAVVLERKEQYDRHGLKPVDPKTVPTASPEPATWITLAVGVGALAAAARRRKDICKRGCK